MPFTKDFNRIKRKFEREYTDRAKAQTFAFEFAFKNKIRTFEERTPKFKKQLGF